VPFAWKAASQCDERAAQLLQRDAVVAPEQAEHVDLDQVEERQLLSGANDRRLAPAAPRSVEDRAVGHAREPRSILHGLVRQVS
jgi:hypothetical protein